MRWHWPQPPTSAAEQQVSRSRTPIFRFGNQWTAASIWSRHGEAAGGQLVRNFLDDRVWHRFFSQQEGGDLQGRFLVQGLVARAALGGVDARGAAVLAGAGRGERQGAPHQVLQDLVGPGRQTHAAGIAVVDEDGRPAHLGMRRVGDAADVVAVRQGKERETC